MGNGSVAGCRSSGRGRSVVRTGGKRWKLGLKKSPRTGRCGGRNQKGRFLAGHRTWAYEYAEALEHELHEQQYAGDSSNRTDDPVESPRTRDPPRARSPGNVRSERRCRRSERRCRGGGGDHGCPKIAASDGASQARVVQTWHPGWVFGGLAGGDRPGAIGRGEGEGEPAALDPGFLAMGDF